MRTSHVAYWLLLPLLSSCGGEVTSPMGPDPSSTHVGNEVAPESASGTMIPPASQIIDSDGVIWTMANGYTHQNGLADGGAEIKTLLYFNGVVYADTLHAGWTVYRKGWRRLAESESGTTVAPATELLDANGTLWTMANGLAYKNGVADGKDSVTQLLYRDGIVYAKAASGWWAHTDAWREAQDPTGGTATSPPS